MISNDRDAWDRAQTEIEDVHETFVYMISETSDLICEEFVLDLRADFGTGGVCSLASSCDVLRPVSVTCEWS